MFHYLTESSSIFHFWFQSVKHIFQFFLPYNIVYLHRLYIFTEKKLICFCTFIAKLIGRKSIIICFLDWMSPRNVIYSPNSTNTKASSKKTGNPPKVLQFHFYEDFCSILEGLGRLLCGTFILSPTSAVLRPVRMFDDFMSRYRRCNYKL